jgi:ACR3 family arsenite efflux pump ArsB
MVFAFAPIVALLLGLSAITVPWDTLLLSVILYIVIPLIIASLWRRNVLNRENGQAQLDQLIARLGPMSLGALLATLILLSDPGLFQFRIGLFAESPAAFPALRRRTVRTDRCK